MAALGVCDHRFLDEVIGDPEYPLARVHYRDSGMVWGPEGQAVAAPDARPDSFALADLDDAAGRLAVIIRETRPQVLITYEPGGGYGHPDHVHAHRVTMRAVELASRPGPGGEPWAVAKVYWVVTPDELVTTVVDGTAFLDAKSAAMRAHASQIAVDGPFFALSNGVGQPILALEFYRLVNGVLGWPKDADGRETDLFAGLSAS
jgi:N-acetyl-1-D-myo-inositol-2-amino-2-deoxy-alpha-D-glucopyranoside deacetylase